MNSLISVIVPVYNVEPYVAQCLESIMTQTYPNIECIVVNDGSTDQSKEICKSYASRDSRIEVMDKENGGLSSARNLGLGRAKGEYISFVDSDDWLAPDMLETLVQNAFKFGSEIVICGFFSVGESTIDCLRNDGTIRLLERVDALNLILEDEEIKSFAWDKLYKRSLFNTIRYPEGRLYEDTATTYKLFDVANSVLQVNRSLYYYRRRTGSITRSDNPVRNFHNFQAFFERYEFARENGLKSENACLREAMKHSVITIDNYSLASQKDHAGLPVDQMRERVRILIRAKTGKMNLIYLLKLTLFEWNPPLYIKLYRLFRTVKRRG